MSNKELKRISQKNWYEKNKEKIKERNKAYYQINKEDYKRKHRERYAKNKDKYKDIDLKRHFGISLQDFKKMLIKQKHCCKICKVIDVTLAVDHCHKTGKVRGLLCGKCNKGLGLFNDNSKLLLKAIKYLNYE